MPDWLFDADVWIKIAAILTAAISLMTAIVTLRKTRATAAEPPQAAGGHRFRVLSIEGEPARPVSTFGLKCMVIISGILTLPMMVLGIQVFSRDPSVGTAFAMLFFVACTASVVYSAKRLWINPQGGTIVKRESSINLQGSYDDLWDECIAALKRAKINIKTLDAKQGLIEGNTSASWKSWGEIVVVQVTRLSNEECKVQIKSDSKMVTTLYDYGKNASNIDRFFQELVH
jgi:hypothetical protein